MRARTSPIPLLCLSLALAASAAFAAAPAAPAGPRAGKWAHELPKAPAPDPQVTWGRLDNGLRYALLPHRGVPGRVALQFIVLAGSLDERPDELGMAHYVEHLCFGGSKNFKAEDMTALFQRLGIEYGSDINAITTFDYTAYRLDFRENDPALLREGLRLFRDFGDGVTFSPAAIEQERRVVRAELRNRNTIAGKRQSASLPLVFRGLKFPEREPGGDEAQIAKFTREQFLAFYKRNYRPDLMVLVGAGDLDVPAMSALVREIFGDMVRPAEPIPVRDEGRLDARGLRAGVLRVSGMGSAAIEAASVAAPLPPKADPREAAIERERRQFVMEVFAQRVRADGEGGSPDAGFEELLGHGLSVASLTVPAKAWSAGVRSLDQLVRLTIERGLDQSDFETLRQRRLKMIGHMVEQLPTLDPGVVCEAITEAVTGHMVFEGFAAELKTRQGWLERFTPAEAQRVFRSLWSPETMAFHVSGGVDLELTGDKVIQDVQKARRTGLGHVMPHTKKKDTPFTMPKFATPTGVAEQRELPALGAKLLRFGNNVRLNFVANKQEPGLARAIVRVGSGLVDMPGNKPALKEFGLGTLLASGAARFRPEAMDALIDERLLEFGFDVADRDAFAFRGAMAAEQLEPFLALVADFLHAPQFNSYAHRDQRLLAAIGRMSSTMGLGDGLRALNDHLFRGDARFTSSSPLDYIAMSVVDVRRWMEEPLARGYVEVTIVGDLTEEAVVQVMTRTLGALRPRAEKKTTATPPKSVTVTADPGYTRIEFVGEQNLGLVVGTWPVTEPIQVRDQAALEILAKVLEIRVRAEVREKLGLAYSPSAEFRAYDGFTNFAVFRAQIDCAPNDSARIAPLVTAIGAELAARGVQNGEFIGARGILRAQLRQAFRESGFLVNVLMRAQERPEEAEEIVALHGGLIDKISRDEVNAWAAKILAEKNCRAAAVVPKAFVGIFDAGR
ncbi:MAG: insulinase family protein [Opitutaceae bacterium]|nr:insulinase family protein [Opitutaceae bacterium]